MLIDKIRQFQTIIESSADETDVLKNIADNLTKQLNIDIVIADNKGRNILDADFKPGDYFYKIPLRAMSVKCGMIYANGIDKLNQNQLSYFYSVATIITVLLRNIYSLKENNIKWQIKSAKVGISSLTISEIKALKCVFENFDTKEGIIVISDIAKQCNITRSVIVNALKKIESAGIIDSRSLGMKGTKIDINNRYFILELKDC